MKEEQITQLKEIISRIQANSQQMTDDNKAGGSIPVSVIDSNSAIADELIKFIEQDEQGRAVVNQR